jgi:hypothetical protein
MSTVAVRWLRRAARPESSIHAPVYADEVRLYPASNFLH